MHCMTLTRKIEPLHVLLLLSGLAAILFAATPARAAWRFDAQRYQNSAHGDLSCAECHENVSDQLQQGLHPAPERVDRELHEFFTQDTCTTCHPDVRDNLAAGTHGGLDVRDPERYERCYRCHDPHTKGAPADLVPVSDPLADMAEEDAACMRCHHAPLDVVDEKAAAASTREFCMGCHDAEKGLENAPLIEGAAYDATPHAGLDCLICHRGADAYPHTRQKPANCEACHDRHDEGVAHDAHMTVACQSCHLGNARPEKHPEAELVLWKTETAPGSISMVHDLRWKDEEACGRCHVKANTVGAVGLTLPPKSVICLPCHAATLTATDTVSALSLLAFFGGLLLVLGVYFSASLPGGGSPLTKLPRLLGGALKTLFSARIVPVAKALWRDVLLQDRLRKRSRERWIIHSLIFLPFVFRFVYGLAHAGRQPLVRGLGHLPGHGGQEQPHHRLAVRRQRPVHPCGRDPGLAQRLGRGQG